MKITELEQMERTFDQKQNELQFVYTFRFSDGTEKEFFLRVEKESLNIIQHDDIRLPDWAKLENFKCPHCPLNESEYPYCPVAVNLVKIIDEFKKLPSFQNAEISVETNARNYSKYTTLQSGVSSLLGILMVSSGCPIMGRLKPLLYFHLPFATLEETQIRALSLYLLSQYVRWKKGDRPDWEMVNLVNYYEDIRILNHNVSKKIANLEEMDTSINSLVILNNFADYVTFTIDEKMIEEIEFYLKDFL